MRCSAWSVALAAVVLLLEGCKSPAGDGDDDAGGASSNISIATSVGQETTVPLDVAFQLIATNSAGQPITSGLTWSSESPSILEVSSSGWAQSIAAGTASVVATSATGTARRAYTVSGGTVVTWPRVRLVPAIRCMDIHGDQCFSRGFTDSMPFVPGVVGAFRDSVLVGDVVLTNGTGTEFDEVLIYRPVAPCQGPCNSIGPVSTQLRTLSGLNGRVLRMGVNVIGTEERNSFYARYEDWQISWRGTNGQFMVRTGIRVAVFVSAGGNWSGSFDDEGIPIPLSLTLNQNGDSLTGNYTINAGGPLTGPINGTVQYQAPNNPPSITLRFAVNLPAGCVGNVTLTANLVRSSMNGQWSGTSACTDAGGGALTLSRQ